MYTLDVNDPDKLFVTSDLHFSHFNICKYCHRPFDSRSDMDHKLIENWNSIVPEDGIVICCGDFMLPHDSGIKEYQKYLKQLNGTIYLTRGNHDRIDCGVYCLYIDGKTQLLNTPKLIVNDMIKINVDGITIFAQHYPCLTWNGDYHIFGHIHTLSDGTCYGVDGDVTKKLRINQYDVGVDQNGYRPISYWELCDIFRKRAKEK